jgi:hypothetical protein
MTLAEVEALVGGPAGSTHPDIGYPPPDTLGVSRHWADGNVHLWVTFDDQDRVEDALFFEEQEPNPPPGMVRRLRHWIGW